MLLDLKRNLLSLDRFTSSLVTSFPKVLTSFVTRQSTNSAKRKLLKRVGKTIGAAANGVQLHGNCRVSGENEERLINPRLDSIAGIFLLTPTRHGTARYGTTARHGTTRQLTPPTSARRCHRKAGVRKLPSCRLSYNQMTLNFHFKIFSSIAERAQRLKLKCDAAARLRHILSAFS